jgi:hypothetical protein
MTLESPVDRKLALDGFRSRFSAYFRQGKEMFYDFTIRTADGGAVIANKGKMLSFSLVPSPVHSIEYRIG